VPRRGRAPGNAGAVHIPDTADRPQGPHCATAGAPFGAVGGLGAASASSDQAGLSSYRHDGEQHFGVTAAGPADEKWAEFPGPGKPPCWHPGPRPAKGGPVAAWIGLVPRQDSTGGKQKLGPISKQGAPYLRRILIVGAIAVLRRAQEKSVSSISRRLPTAGSSKPGSSNLS
jgi:Transposase IS116/IS110/IS902 family